MTRDNELGQQLLSIRNLLLEINENPDAQLDLSKFNFAPPTLSVVLSALAEQSSKTIIAPSNSYLDTICFPNGLKPDQKENWNDVLDSYTHKSYIPLIHFPTSSELDNFILSI